jgi:hypothetical protein
MNEIATTEPGGMVSASSAQTTTLLNIIAAAVHNPAVDVAKLSALMDLQERVLTKEAEAEFNRDYLAMQLELPRIKKDGSVAYPVNKNDPDGPKKKAFDFASWDNIDTVIRPLLQKHGFGLMFDSSPRPGDGGGIMVTATLLHRSGHKKTASFASALDTGGGKNNVQGMGSSFSYCKRYAVTALLNIVTEGQDDDGMAAGIRFITDVQKEEIIGLLKDSKADVTGFLRHFGIAAVDEMETKSYAAAVNMLRAKLRKAGGQ